MQPNPRMLPIYCYVNRERFPVAGLSAFLSSSCSLLFCLQAQSYITCIETYMISFNPLQSGDTRKGNWQIVQTQIRRRKTLIRVFTVCKQFIHFSLEISKYHSRTNLKLKLDSFNIYTCIYIVCVCMFVCICFEGVSIQSSTD